MVLPFFIQNLHLENSSFVKLFSKMFVSEFNLKKLQEKIEAVETAALTCPDLREELREELEGWMEEGGFVMVSVMLCDHKAC